MYILKSTGATLLKSADGEPITTWQKAADTKTPPKFAEASSDIEQQKKSAVNVNRFQRLGIK